MAKLVSKVYGDALFSVALEENKLEELWKEAVAINQTISENPEFLSVLCHPEMTQEKKNALLEDVFKDASQDMKGLLHVLVKKGRIGEILSVLEYFDAKVKEHLKVGVVNVSTPTALTDVQKEQIEKRILEVSGYETLEVCYETDASLLGGIVIRIGNRVLDNSIRSKLDAMARELNKVKLSN